MTELHEYTEEFFDYIERGSITSAKRFSALIVPLLKIKSLLVRCRMRSRRLATRMGERRRGNCTRGGWALRSSGVAADSSTRFHGS